MDPRSLSRTAALTGALLWRTWRDQGWRLLAQPALFAALFGALVVISLMTPDEASRNQQTLEALRRLAAAQFGVDPGSNLALALVLLVLQGPFLVGTFASVTGALTAQTALGGEAARGGIEALASGPYTPREVLRALLCTSFALTLFMAGVLAVLTLVAPTVALQVLSAGRMAVPGFHVAVAVLLPLSLALWANAVTFLMGVLFPGLIQVRVGAGASAVQLAASLPAVILFLFFWLNPGADLLRRMAWAAASGVLAAALATWCVGRWSRIDALLEQTP